MMRECSIRSLKKNLATMNDLALKPILLAFLTALTTIQVRGADVDELYFA